MKPPSNRDRGSFEPVPVGFFFFERFFFFFFAAVGSPSSLASAASSASSSAAASFSSAPSSVAAGFFFFFFFFFLAAVGSPPSAGAAASSASSSLRCVCRPRPFWSGCALLLVLLLALFASRSYWYACTVVACKVQHSLLVERSSLDCSRLEELSLLQPRTAGLWRAAWTVYEQFANEPQNATS